MTKIICSICSRQKSGEPGELPARQRYTGTHIKKVGEEALKHGLPFFILSGRFGLIGADDPVPNYDYKLGKDGVLELSDRIANQLAERKVRTVYFYTKRKHDWAPYLDALQRAARRCAILVEVRLLRNDD